MCVWCTFPCIYMCLGPTPLSDRRPRPTHIQPNLNTTGGEGVGGDGRHAAAHGGDVDDRGVYVYAYIYGWTGKEAGRSTKRTTTRAHTCRHATDQQRLLYMYRAMWRFTTRRAILGRRGRRATRWRRGTRRCVLWVLDAAVVPILWLLLRGPTNLLT